MSSKKIKVGITGASGYSGTELIRLLARHPNVELACVTSRGQAGKKVADEMPALRHLIDADLRFTASSPQGQAEIADIDVWFLALPHGVAAEYASALINVGKKVIDISADFRLSSLETYKKYYGVEHPAPELMKMAKYIIPELFDNWQDCNLIACAGCYPTSILVPMIPLLREGLKLNKHIVIDSYSSVSGAGKKADVAYIFCERNESIKGYGFTSHRHLSEVEEQLSLAFGDEIVVQFNPHLAPINRGILTTITVPANGSTIEELYAAWNKYYENANFIKVLPVGSYPDTAHIATTNRCDISAIYDSRTDNFIISSVVDNLCKGASGQAVQIMNAMFGLDEKLGLL